MRKSTVFAVCATLGAVLAVYLSESDWVMAAITGAALGLSTALFVYVYPADAAPPADRRHEASMRRKAQPSKGDFKTPARS
ncbi:MAG TPA: hypothetical protein VGB91_10555 [Rhizomicrobium sp.]